MPHKKKRKPSPRRGKITWPKLGDWPKGEERAWAREVAEIVYDLPEKEEIWAWGERNWPGYSGASEAAYQIREKLFEVAQGQYGFPMWRLSEENQDILSEELGEMIYAGLT